MPGKRINTNLIAFEFNSLMLKILRESLSEEISAKNHLDRDAELIKIQKDVISKMEEITLEIERHIDMKRGRGMGLSKHRDDRGGPGGGSELSDEKKKSLDLDIEVYAPEEFDENLARSLEELKQRTQELTEKQQEIDEQLRELTEKQEEINIQLRELEMRRRELESKEAELENRKIMLDKKKRELDDREKRIEKKEEELGISRDEDEEDEEEEMDI